MESKTQSQTTKMDVMKMSNVGKMERESILYQSSKHRMASDGAKKFTK